MDTILQALLYGTAPFYTYPFKPVINQIIGSGYPSAYSNFRRDHSKTSNIVAHCACFVGQLVGNFSLLKLISEAVPYCSLLPEVSAALWAASLFVAHGCPPDVKIAALGSVAAGYRWGHSAIPHWQDLAFAQSFFEAIAIANLIGEKRGGGLALVPGAAFLAGRLALHSVVFGSRLGSLATPTMIAGAYGFSFLYLTLTAIKENPVPLPGKKDFPPIYCFTFALFGWAIAGLTNQSTLFFLGMGFMANVMQVRVTSTLIPNNWERLLSSHVGAFCRVPLMISQDKVRHLRICRPAKKEKTNSRMSGRIQHTFPAFYSTQFDSPCSVE